MSKEYNSKRFISKVNHLKKEMEKSIVSMMIENNVEMISFANNGNYGDFDVDKTFALMDDFVAEYYEVLAVKVDKATKSLYILVESSVDFSDIDILESGVFFNFDTNTSNLIDDDKFISVEDTLSPFDTTEQLYISVAETLNIKDEIEEPYN